VVYTLRFFPSKCSLFHNSNVFGSCIIHILYTGCAKIKKIIPRQKVNSAFKGLTIMCSKHRGDTALQPGRSRVRFPIVSLGFFIDIYHSYRAMALGSINLLPPELFFFNFSTSCIQNVNNTGTKYVRIMKQTAFWREKNGENIPCLKYSVPIFVE